MELKIIQEESRVRFDISGDIDEEGANDLENSFYKLDMSSTKEIIFNLQEVSHIGSAGMGRLLLFYKDSSIGGGGKIRIENVSETVSELLKIVQLDRLFPITKAKPV